MQADAIFHLAQHRDSAEIAGRIIELREAEKVGCHRLKSSWRECSTGVNIYVRGTQLQCGTVPCAHGNNSTVQNDSSGPLDSIYTCLTVIARLAHDRARF